MKTFALRQFLYGLIAAALVIGGSLPAPAQTYPTTTPTYIPTAILSPQTACAAACDINFYANNVGAVTFDILGTNTGVVGTFQGAAERTGTVTWNNMKTVKRGSSAVGTVTGDGVYTVNPGGYAYVRFHMTAISTGSVIVNASGTPAAMFVDVNPLVRNTYAATATSLVAANSATDIFTIIGAANKTIRVNKICVSGRATAVAGADVQLIKRSTADTGGTSTAPTAVPLSATNAAAAATLAAYTANPTTGTAVGTLGVRQLFLGNLTTGVSGIPACWTWSPNSQIEQEVALNAATEQLAINLNGVTYSGNLLDIEVEWTEE